MPIVPILSHQYPVYRNRVHFFKNPF